MEVAVIAASELDPVLEACIFKLTKDALSIWKYVDGVSGWQQCYMAVRCSWFCFTHSYDSVIQLANSMSHHDPSDECVDINLAACSSCKAPQHDDFDHCAFILTTSSGQLLLVHRETDFAMSIT
jgi:hypothetical protein